MDAERTSPRTGRQRALGEETWAGKSRGNGVWRGGIPLAFGGSFTALPVGTFRGPALIQPLPLGFLLIPLFKKKYHGFHPQPWDGRKDVELVLMEGLLWARLCARSFTYSRSHEL